MPAKVRRAVLAEQGAAVVAIDRNSLRAAILKITTLSLAFILLTHCGVELASTTPGANATCSPSSADLASFTTNQYNAIFVNRGCMGCHATTASVSSRFKLISSNTTTDQVSNLCTSYRFGQLDANQTLINFPRSASHPGGVSTTAEIQALIDWVNTFRL